MRKVGAAAPWAAVVGGERKKKKKKKAEGGGKVFRVRGRREADIFKEVKGKGCVWLGEIRGFSDDL